MTIAITFSKSDSHTKAIPDKDRAVLFQLHFKQKLVHLIYGAFTLVIVLKVAGAIFVCYNGHTISYADCQQNR